MKLNKNNSTFIALCALFTLFSCSEQFLDVAPNGKILQSNYYKNEDEAYSALGAAYDVMSKESSTFENMIAMMNAGSDDHFAGGGTAGDGAAIQSFSNYTLSPSVIATSFWDDYYKGIYRANLLLSELPSIPMDNSKKARFTAESKALRAYYYFQLERLFKNIPLITTLIAPTPEVQKGTKQAAPEEVYAQIEKDLLDAITVLPTTVSAETEGGRFTKGGAQALLGKVYLYEGKNALAAAALAEVNGTPGGTSQYGYKLLKKFSDLWVVSNKFNSESIIEISHTNKAKVGWGDWGNGRNEGNTLCQMVGPRVYSVKKVAPDYAGGWSFNVITQDLYDVLKVDPRFNATIADLKALLASGNISYDVTGSYQDTGYYLKKFMPLTSDKTPGTQDELNYQQNTYAIRLADTYLMEAEALGATGTRAQALLDAVRARVGLTSIPVSMDNIMKERRLELAGEGHRWFDLVRTGKAATVLASRGFVAGKNEIWPIPLKEFNNTSLVQNPNYSN